MILLGNGRVITWDEEQPYFEDGAVVVEGTTIVEVGSTTLLRVKYQNAEYIDVQGKVIMPGLINTHEHIYSAFTRGLSIPNNHPQNFLEILKDTWWNIDRHLDLKATYYSALVTYMECIKNGVTTVIDHHASYGGIRGSLDMIAKAAHELGIRTCLCYEISDRDGKDKMLEAVSENFDFLEKLEHNPDDMLKGLIGLHASFTLSDETLDLCEERNQNRWGYHIHVAESVHDEIYTQRHYHMSVVERLEQKGILGDKSIVGHCIHISKNDMDILKKTNTTVIHTPESNMANAVGAPDILSMFEKGICVGLGTDGYTNDMFESLKVANILCKHRSGKTDKGFLESAQMCFANNASIISSMFGRTFGVLKKDAVADLIVIDYEPLTSMNASNIYAHAIFGMSGTMTELTMINGRIVMKDRIILPVDEKTSKAESRKAATALWNELGVI